MNATDVLNVVLWSVQGLLALFFLAAGAPKLIGRGLERWTGFSDLPRAQVVFIGSTEVLGAVGLVLPMATDILPWLTPLAAVGLAIIVLMAAGFHLRADERPNALETGLLAGIAAAVAIGRWDLVASRVDLSPWALVAALAVLVPAAIINVIVLWKRTASSGTPRPVADPVGTAARRPSPTRSWPASLGYLAVIVKGRSCGSNEHQQPPLPLNIKEQPWGICGVYPFSPRWLLQGRWSSTRARGSCPSSPNLV